MNQSGQAQAQRPDGLRFQIGGGPNAPAFIPKIDVQIGFDSVLLIAAMGWALWTQALRPTLQDRLSTTWAPVEEERKLTGLLAQMAILARADRAILVAFHNGTVDHDGYHLQRMTTINQFVSEGSKPMPKPIKDVPIGRIMIELEAMLASGSWTTIQRRRGMPPLCVKHLEDNGMYFMAYHLVTIGNLPVGIVSLQYTTKRRSYFDCQKNGPHMLLLSGLFDQIRETMKRRVIKPPPMARLRLAVARILEVGTTFRRR